MTGLLAGTLMTAAMVLSAVVGVICALLHRPRRPADVSSSSPGMVLALDSVAAAPTPMPTARPHAGMDGHLAHMTGVTSPGSLAFTSAEMTGALTHQIAQGCCLALMAAMTVLATWGTP